MIKVLGRLAGIVVALALLNLGSAFAQVTTTYNGILTVTWGDPKPGVIGGAVRFRLTEPNGAAHQLEIAPAQQGQALQLFGKPVTVRGRANQRAAGGPSTIVVDEISAAQAPGVTPQRLALTTKKALLLLLKFKGDNQEPHPISFYKNLFSPKKPVAGSGTPTTINEFFDKVSWGQLQFATAIGGHKWFTLPGTKHDYAPCDNFGSSCFSADIDAIAQDAMTLAVAAGIDVTAYETVNFVVNNDLDCCAWGGGFFFNGRSYSATWEPPWAQHAETYVHELGHSLGLPHSGWTYYAYDSPWDIMSMHSQIHAVACGSYTSMNSGNTTQTIDCPEPGSGYIAAHKDFLGWIPAANSVTINKKTSAAGRNITLSDGSAGLGSTVKMIKICFAGKPCSGGSGHFLTVEVKMASRKFDRGVPHNGVIIHDVQMNRPSIGGGCYFNSQSGWAKPIDATPGDFDRATCTPETSDAPSSGGAALGNAQFGPGDTYSNASRGIKVTVKNQTASGFVVNVIRSK